MKKIILQLIWLLSFASLAGALDDFRKEQLRIATELESLSMSEARFVLYSLDPEGGIGYAVNNEVVFHGFRILGKAEASTPKDKAALLTSFVRGVRESDGVVAACFNPRHGIRLVIGKAVYDFVICFECQSIMVYGFNEGRGFLTTGSPNGVFNSYIEKYHLKNAKKGG